MDKETEAQTVTPNPGKQLPSGGSNCKPTMASCSDYKAYMLSTDGAVSMIWGFKRGRDHIQVRFFLNFIFSKHNFKRLNSDFKKKQILASSYADLIPALRNNYFQLFWLFWGWYLLSYFKIFASCIIFFFFLIGDSEPNEWGVSFVCLF